MFEGVWVIPYFLEKTNLLSSDLQKTFFPPDNQISHHKIWISEYKNTTLYSGKQNKTKNQIFLIHSTADW